MGVRYGTVSGVKNKALNYNQDFVNSNPADDARIEEKLDQASDKIRDIVQTRYSIATIDAAQPPAITEYAEILAAWLLISADSITGTSNSNSDSSLMQLKKQMYHYKKMILFGNLLDASNTPLATNPTVVVSTSGSNTALEDIYS
jgi:hypothetical protein